MIKPDDSDRQVMPAPLRRDEPLFDTQVMPAMENVLDGGGLLRISKT